MKKINEVKALQSQLSEESRQAALAILIANQIEGLEKLMEGNTAHVKSVLAYNQCVGLIEQVKYYSGAAFNTPDENLLIAGEHIPKWVVDGPIFGKSNE
jgi:hypothetical protein